MIFTILKWFCAYVIDFNLAMITLQLKKKIQLLQFLILKVKNISTKPIYRGGNGSVFIDLHQAQIVSQRMCSSTG